MVTTPVRPSPRGRPPRRTQPPRTSAVASQKRRTPRGTGTATGSGTGTGARSKASTFFKEFWPRIEGSNRPSNGSSYYMILGATLALTCIGLMMVFSASAVESIAQGADPYELGVRESIFAAFGLALMFGLSRATPKFLKRVAWPGMLFSATLLILVLAIGVQINGNKNWIRINDSLSFQPSEAVKLALALWMASVFSRKESMLRLKRHLFVPVVPVAAAFVILVLAEGDLGTSMILMAIVAAGLYFAGAPARIFVGAGLAGAMAAVALALTNSNRLGRLAAWQGQCANDPFGLCDQARNGLYGMASGGWLGVGLGQSRQKWNWIPEAHNDFIFAIIGEEFGLLGTIIIVVLYGVIALAIFRVIVRHNDLFIRVVCGCIMAWIIGQAFVNIAMVTGLLPVIGVPLPLISYGGTALTLVLAAIGVVLSFARSSPESDKAPS